MKSISPSFFILIKIRGDGQEKHLRTNCKWPFLIFDINNFF